MRKKLLICLALLFIVPGLLFMTSCSSQTVDESEPEAVEEEAQPEAEPEMEEPEAEEATSVYEGEDTTDMDAEQMFYNENVYFAFDRAVLTEMGQEVLQRKADFMNKNDDLNISIEGHCDERGTNEYNLALGDRRAEAAKDFLVDLGIDASRISTVSYGEERPVDPGSSEEAWAKNRRASVASE